MIISPIIILPNKQMYAGKSHAEAYALAAENTNDAILKKDCFEGFLSVIEKEANNFLCPTEELTWKVLNREEAYIEAKVNGQLEKDYETAVLNSEMLHIKIMGVYNARAIAEKYNKEPEIHV